MTPEERTQMDDMQRRLAQLELAENVSFIENIKRKVGIVPDGEVRALLAALQLSDLANVDAASPSNGEVLKYNSTSEKWEPATDNV